MPEVLGIPEIIGDKRDKILQIAKQNGAYHVRVFGSVARGEANPQSDVDFLVDFEAGRSLFDLAGLKQDLEDLLGRSVDVVVTGNPHSRFLPLILDEAIDL